MARKKFCGAKTRSGKPCRKPPLKNGNGRCKLHGGLSTGPPKGSKNALKTGEYESIVVDQLDGDERELFDRAKIEKKPLIEEELRLITIRERRMMNLIKRYRARLGELVVISEEKKETDGDDGSEKSITVKREAVESSLMRTEEALTRVQAQKARLIDLLHKMQIDDSGDSSLDRLAASIASLRQKQGG